MCRAEKCINLRFGHWRRVVGALRHIEEASKARSTQLPWDLPCLSTSHRTPCEKQRDGACVKRHVRLHTIQTCGHWTWKQLWRNKLLNICLFILEVELYFWAAPLNTKTQESFITQMQQVVMPHAVWWEWWHDPTILYGKNILWKRSNTKQSYRLNTKKQWIKFVFHQVYDTLLQCQNWKMQTSGNCFNWLAHCF